MFRPLKAFLIELALGWVGHKTSMTLDPKFKLPKIKYKGEEVSYCLYSMVGESDVQSRNHTHTITYFKLILNHFVVSQKV